MYLKYEDLRQGWSDYLYKVYSEFSRPVEETNEAYR